MYDTLNLVNACLRAIGNDEVDDLEFPDTDTAIAISTISEMSVAVCSKGWWFNQEPNWVIGLDDEGRIQLPNTVLDFRTESDPSRTVLTRRGGFIYNIREHTFDLSSIADNNNAVTLTLIMSIPVEDMPLVAQQYTRQTSITRYLTDLEADKIKIEKSMDAEIGFLALIDRQELRNMRDNIYDSPKVSAVMSSVASHNGVLGGFNGNPLGSSENS